MTEKAIERAIVESARGGIVARDAARAAYRVLAPRMRELEGQRDEARAEVERLRAELADARRFLDQRRNDVAAWRDSYERLSRQVLRRHHAWQSARRGRKHARAELATVRREAHRDRLAVDGALDRIDQLIGERNQAEADVDRAETERDRLAEQVERVRARRAVQCGGACASIPCECGPGDLECAECETPHLCPTLIDLDETEAGT